MELQCRRNDRFGPIGSVLKFVEVQDCAAFHMEQEFELGSFAGCGIGIDAIVVDAQFRQMGHELDQIDSALLEAALDEIS